MKFGKEKKIKQIRTLEQGSLPNKFANHAQGMIQLINFIAKNKK